MTYLLNLLRLCHFVLKSMHLVFNTLILSNYSIIGHKIYQDSQITVLNTITNNQLVGQRKKQITNIHGGKTSKKTVNNLLLTTI